MKTQGIVQGLLLSFATVLCLTGASTSTAMTTDHTEVEDDGRCGRCGDGSCVASCGESATTCPRDCGGEAEASASDVMGDHEDARCGRCGDGFCSTQCGETSTSCPADCGTST